MLSPLIFHALAPADVKYSRKRILKKVAFLSKIGESNFVVLNWWFKNGAVPVLGVLIQHNFPY
jgi:hypothetical protein